MSRYDEQIRALSALRMATVDGFFVLDTETTGLGNDAEIVEVSIVAFNGKVVLNTLIKPTKPIPAEATDIHGITDEMVSDAPSWEQVRGDIGWLLVTNPLFRLCIYNADYDTRLFVQTERIHGGRSFSRTVFNAFCVMDMYANFYGESSDHHDSYKWQGLLEACHQMDIDTSEFVAHRALGDCQMTLALINKLLETTPRKLLQENGEAGA